MYIQHKYVLHRVDFVFPQSLLRYQHTCSTCEWDAVKLYAEASELFRQLRFSSSSSAKRRLRNASLRDQKGGSRRVLKWTMGEMRENNFKAHTSAAKVMASVFWDSEGILLAEFSERRATMNSQRMCRHESSWNNEFEVFGQMGRRIRLHAGRVKILRDRHTASTAKVARVWW
jgi:hypothetical protein